MTKIDALPRPVGATLLSLLAIALAALALPASSLADPPPLVASPFSLAFEKTTVGNQAPNKEIELVNVDEAEAPVDTIAIAGEDAAAFNLGGSSCGQMPLGMPCSVSIGFSPGSAGEKHANVVISFKNGRPAESFEISGTGVAPQLSFSPPSYDFGMQRVYETRNYNLQVTNSGEAMTRFENYEMVGGSGSFWTGNSSCPGMWLQPGESCNIEVNFNPQDAIAYTAELKATANGVGFTAPLSGQGGRAIIEATPNPAEFGAMTVGAVSAAQTITITNSGNIPAGFFIGIVAGGDSGSFQLLSENCTGAELMPAASCTAQVRFRPQEAGPKAAYMAFFGDNDGGAMVGLKGEGVAPAVTLVPSAFDFGLQAAGSKSAAHDFALRNEGSTALDLGTVSIVGADLDQFALAGDECTGETLAPGAECLVRVRFTPDSAGAKAAKLRVGSEAGAFVATLSGTGEGVIASADGHRDGAFGYPGAPPPPPPARKARNRRFVRGETLSAGKLQRPRRVHVRASHASR